MNAEQESKWPDPGLAALVMLLRFHGLGADPEQIRHRFGRGTIGIPEMLRCAKELGLKARARLATWERLASTPLPAIVALRDGGFLLLGKVGDGKDAGAVAVSAPSRHDGRGPNSRRRGMVTWC
jgi:ATP-binding cassette, subfamily B, bacterial HlyB/CyaB